MLSVAVLIMPVMSTDCMSWWSSRFGVLQQPSHDERSVATWDSEQDSVLGNVHLLVLHEQVLSPFDQRICTQQAVSQGCTFCQHAACRQIQNATGLHAGAAPAYLEFCE